LLTRIACLIRTAVDVILARERAVIANDFRALDGIRQKMGLDSNADLDDLRVRYDGKNDVFGRPDK